MNCDLHAWFETGERRPHVDFVMKGERGRHQRVLVNAIYVRCAACRKVGYRNADRPESRVVYTWSQPS